MKTHTRLIAAIFALCTLAAAWPASAAPDPTDFFLKVTGVNGGSRQVDHMKWIDIEGFTLDVSHPLGQTAVPGPMRIAKKLDRATVGLAFAALGGGLVSEVIVDACAVIGDAGLKPIFQLVLTGVFITAVQPEQGGKNATEVVVFDGYHAMQMIYYIYNNSGVLVGKIEKSYP
ncbi:MAG TPA: type VI secretion system tube protein Hcp [bacterium]